MAARVPLSTIMSQAKTNAVVWAPGPAPGQQQLTIYSTATGRSETAIVTTQAPTRPEHWVSDPLVDPADWGVS